MAIRVSMGIGGLCAYVRRDTLAGMATVFGYGSGGFGTVGFGAASTFKVPLNLLDAYAIRENVVRVEFDLEPYFTGMLDPYDASIPEYYSIVPIAGTSDSNGNAARPVGVIQVNAVEGNPKALDLTLDRAMTGYPAQYRAVLDPLMVVNAEDFGSLAAAEPLTFYGVRQGQLHNTPEYVLSNRDIANPVNTDGLPVEGGNVKLGVYNANGQGDLAWDEGLVGLRKRVIRRLSTRKGQYSHLPNYGVLAISNVKQLSRLGLREMFAVDAEDQIRQEPEVTRVSVTLETDPNQPEFFVYKVKAKTRFGQTLSLIHRATVEKQ